jgi:hypothetical protein
MSPQETQAEFKINVPGQYDIEVLDESRRFEKTRATISDKFDGYQTHLYKLVDANKK